MISFDFIRTFSMFDGLVVLVTLCRIKTLSLILMDSVILLDFGRSVMTVKTQVVFRRAVIRQTMIRRTVIRRAVIRRAASRD